jgi:hypothetical protein
MKITLPSLLSLLLALPCSALAQIQVAPWQMHDGHEGLVDHLTNSPIPSESEKQKRAGLDKANPPPQSEASSGNRPGWKTAPAVNGVVNYGEEEQGSVIPVDKSFQVLDFLYFQTTVDIPAGTKIDTFQVKFDSVDDAARVWIFNSKHPAGYFNPANDITAKKNGALVDFSGEAVAGEKNRILVAQYDLCPPGNHIQGINVIVNGQPIQVQTKRAVIPSSHGDVHISTPDGLVYDFQGTGEFLAAQSADGRFVIQARQEKWATRPSVSVNTALVLLVDGTKLEFYATPKFQWFINGESQAIPTRSGRAVVTGKDGKPGLNYHWTVTSSGTVDYTLYRADEGWGFRVIVVSGSHLDYGHARLGGMDVVTGMLGDSDGNPQNDLTLRDGSKVTPPANAKDLNTFTDSWRLKPGEAIFGDVQRAAALAAEAKPHADVQVDAAKSAEAEKAVRAAGITDPLAVRNATYDVAMTDSKGFIETAKIMDEAVKELPAAERKLLAGDAANQEAVAAVNEAANRSAGPSLKERVVELAALGGKTWEGSWSWTFDDNLPQNHSKLTMKSETEFTYTYANQFHKLKGTIGHSGGDPKAPLCVNLDLPNGDHLRFEWKSEEELIGQFWRKGTKQGLTTYNEPQTTAQMKLVKEK